MVVFSVTTCGKATDALSLLREDISKFDLVISDVYMPDMDGFKLLELVGLEMDLPVISKYQLYGALLCIFIYLCGFSFFFPSFSAHFFSLLLVYLVLNWLGFPWHQCLIC